MPTLLDLPRPLPRSEYDRALAAMVRRLSALPAYRAALQIGSVRTPGISDLDVIAVFDDGVMVEANPLADLDRNESYAFVHSVLAGSQTVFLDSLAPNFFFRYVLLDGQDPRPAIPAQTCRSPEWERQVAVQFLIRQYCNFELEAAQGVLKVRGLLLQGRAALIDLEILDRVSGPFAGLMRSVVDWRERWFHSPPTRREVVELHAAARETLGALLEELLQEQPLYVLPAPELRIGGLFQLVPANRFNLLSSGARVASLGSLARFSRRVLSVQNRWLKLSLLLPIQSAGLPPAVEAALQAHRSAASYNRKFLPNFMPLATSFAVH